MTVKVLFVCLGNICRSPSAQGILQKMVDDNGLSEQFVIDSCGTAPFNVGKSPDKRAIEAASRHGYNIEDQIARQIHNDDYQQFQYIIAMDHKNLSSVQTWAPDSYDGEITLFMKYGSNRGLTQVADPYYEDSGKFDAVIATLEKAAHGFLKYVVKKHRLQANKQSNKTA